MRRWVVKIFLFCSFVISAQKKESNVTDYLTKNDQVPFLKYEKGELDTLMTYNKMIPLGVEGSGSNCYRTVSFKVDRNGKINSIKHLSSVLDLPKGRVLANEDAEPKIHEEVRKEVERLIQLTQDLWFSDSIREKNDVIMKLTFRSNSRKTIEDSPNTVYATNLETAIASKKDLYNFGVKKMNANRIILARIYFEQAIAFNPKDIDAHYNLATCYYKLKRNTEACEHWKKCVELGDQTVNNELKKYCN